jgi:predicted CoA-substrate-specific enzyme activase
MRYFCGIDIGASATKLVIVDDNRQTVAKSLRPSGVNYAATAQRCLEDALAAAGLRRDDIKGAFATGYGRDNVPWAGHSRTEIACHGKGAHFHFRRQMTVIDVGAQDSKVIHLDDRGHRTSFKMNRKCAAGTGAFLEEMSARLDIPLERMNDLAARSTDMVKLGSFCTVFSATEVLENIRHGKKIEDIVKGVFFSVIRRVLEMDAMSENVVMTGGVVAHNLHLVRMMEDLIARPIWVPEKPQLTGAIGAAIYAMDNQPE